MTQRARRHRWLLIGFVVLLAVVAMAFITSGKSEDPLPSSSPADDLEVTQVIPADGTTGVETDVTILVTFSRPVVPLTAISDPASANLPDPLVLLPDIEGNGEWLNTSTYMFVPNEHLAGGTEYTATIPAGLSDVAGGLLAEDVVSSFVTVRPKVVWIDPSRSEDHVPVNAPIRITFNMPIAEAGVAERLTVRTASLLGELLARRLQGTITVEGETLTFTPSAPLDFDKQYVVDLDPGVTGEAGGLGTTEKTHWQFRTVPLPRIISTDPRNGEDDAYPYTSFVIQFNTTIDPDTVMENVSIEPVPEPEELDTWYRGWDQNYVIRFGAKPSQAYTFRIAPHIADPFGNETGQTMTVSFETAPLSPTAWLHVPGHVSTLSTSEPARLVVGHRNTDQLSLKLWKIDLAEYFEAMSDWYDFEPAGRPDRTWTVPVEPPLNEVDYAPVDLAEGGGSLLAGIYVVELRASGVDWDRWNHRHLLVSSHINLTLKTTEDDTLAWATDLETGDPVPGLILSAYDSDGEKIKATITDGYGLALLPGTEAADWRGLTIVCREPFVLAETDWTDGISIWDLGLSSETPPDRRAFLDTDRPIYRPDQTVFFRGVIRDERDASYTVPELLSIDVTIRDPEWEVVYDNSLPLDAFGIFSGSIDLPADAPLGDYSIRAEVGGRTFYHEFQVAAYRAPEFEVTVTPDRSESARDQTIRALVRAEYFFGAAVADVPVEWHVVSEDYHFAPSAFGRYSFDDVDDPWTCWSCWWILPSPPLSVLDGSGTTDTDGHLLIELPSDIASLSPDPDAEPLVGSRTLTIEATAQGTTGESVSGRSSIIVHRANFYVGLAAGRNIGQAEEETSIDLVTVDWTAERMAEVSLRYTVFRREWSNVFEEDETGGGRWTWTAEDIEITAGSLVTDGLGDAQLTFTPSEGGAYKIVVEGDDDAGRTARSSLFVWISAPESVSWRRTNDDTIQLISDQTTYAVGDTAEILIPSPYPGEQWALVTVERGGVLSRDVVQLPSNSSTIRIPMTDDHIPNVYVGVVLVQGRQAALAAAAGQPAAAGTKVGYIPLTVETEPKELRIEILPSASRVEPGETVTIDVRVTDDEGLPARATFSLDLVDKAILSLRPRVDDAILAAFYSRRGLGVRTSSGLSVSLSRLILEQLDDLDLVDADKMAFNEEQVVGAAPPAMMAEAAPTSLRASDDTGAAEQLPANVELREEFLDTAYWHPAIVTDEEGFARVEVELPDNLTTWMLRSVGVTRDTLVGEETAEILVTKPLLVRPTTPRFLVVGDRVRLAASVSNQTDEPLDIEVTLGTTGVELEDPPVQSILVPAGSEVRVTWWANVLDVDSVDLAFSAMSGELSDAARPRLTLNPDGTLPVFRYTARETVGTAGQLSEEGSRIEAIVLPPAFDAEASELAVRLDPSLAAAMTEGLSYLEHFEYECTEQLVSRFLPNALTYRALTLLGIKDPELEEKLADLVPEALAELAERQNGDGGWGWWAGESSNPHLTAYATFALLKLKEIDRAVDDAVLDRALDFLEDALLPARTIESPWDANRNAWILYVLSLGRPALASEHTGSLFDHREMLSHYGRAFLALAIAELEGRQERLDALLSDLVNDAILSATGAHWEEEAVDWWAMNTDTRSTAIILDALVRIDPTNALLPNAVRWLMVARDAGIWETTQETAWALISLTDWMVFTQELRGDYEIRVGLDDEPLLIDSVTPDTVRQPRTVTVVGAEMIDRDTHTLSIARGDGDGTLYYTAHWTVGLPVDAVDALDRGITIQREYLAIDASEGESSEDRTAVAVGETIQVRLTIVVPNDLYYVVVEDPIPAGCEAVDPSLATTSILEPEPGLSREENASGWWPGWWWRWFSRSEFRDQKVVLFTDFLSAGTYTYTYMLRGLTPGTYNVLPSSAHEFYFPEVFGRSEGRVLRVTEE